MKFLTRCIVTALATAFAIWLIPGIDLVGSVPVEGVNLSVGMVSLERILALLLFGFVLSLVNILVKPILKVLSLPITVLTLGLFYLVINIAMIYLASSVCMGVFGVGLAISNWLAALVASLVISIVSAILNGVVGAEK